MQKANRAGRLERRPVVKKLWAPCKAPKNSVVGVEIPAVKRSSSESEEDGVRLRSQVTAGAERKGEATKIESYVCTYHVY